MKKKAFTLIELLVVISIIAMLLAILMPALGIVKKKAQSVVCGSNVGQLAKAWYLYAAENDGAIAGATTNLTTDDGYWSWACQPQTETGTSRHSGSSVEEKEWGIKRGTIYPYVENTKLYHCPGDQRYKTAPLIAGWGGKGGYRSYSMPGGLNGIPEAGGWGIKPLQKQSQITRTSSTLIYLEESDGRGYNMGSWVIRPVQDEWVDPISIWHKDSSSLGFADGHAENHKWVEEGTIEMSEKQEPYYTDEGSRDIEYVQKRYPYKSIL